MSNVYGYGRLALANDEEKVQQLKVIDDYCVANNLRIDEYFFDNGASGLNFDRTDFKRLLSVLQKGDMVVIPSISKLSRNSHQLIDFMEQMESDGIVLKFVDLETK